MPLWFSGLWLWIVASLNLRGGGFDLVLYCCVSAGLGDLFMLNIVGVYWFALLIVMVFYMVLMVLLCRLLCCYSVLFCYGLVVVWLFV